MSEGLILGLGIPLAYLLMMVLVAAGMSRHFIWKDGFPRSMNEDEFSITFLCAFFWPFGGPLVLGWWIGHREPHWVKQQRKIQEQEKELKRLERLLHEDSGL